MGGVGALMRLAYPTLHRGSHKGVPLRGGFGKPKVSPAARGKCPKGKGGATLLGAVLVDAYGGDVVGGGHDGGFGAVGSDDDDAPVLWAV